MNRAPVDLNLLFGVLALQMDFIDRDALVGAMQAWVFAKDKTLGQILLDVALVPVHLVEMGRLLEGAPFVFPSDMQFAKKNVHGFAGH